MAEMSSDFCDKHSSIAYLVDLNTEEIEIFSLLAWCGCSEKGFGMLGKWLTVLNPLQCFYKS